MIGGRAGVFKAVQKANQTKSTTGAPQTKKPAKKKRVDD